jgi:16S rRNA (guanine527-N7)-methyltransferase
VLGRGALRATFDAVLARSFGPPAATAECGSPLLHVGGELMVSEPPQDDQRWSAEVSQLGLEVGRRVGSTPVVQTLRQITLCPERFPRRDGLPAKRPLF